MSANPIEPTTGRIVLYVLPVEYADQPRKIRPAIIVDVIDDTHVDLQQFTNGEKDTSDLPTPTVIWRDRVRWHQPRDGHMPEPHTWHWMPYQFGLEIAKRAREARQSGR